MPAPCRGSRNRRVRCDSAYHSIRSQGHPAPAKRARATGFEVEFISHGVVWLSMASGQRRGQATIAGRGPLALRVRRRVQHTSHPWGFWPFDRRVTEMFWHVGHRLSGERPASPARSSRPASTSRRDVVEVTRRALRKNFASASGPYAPAGNAARRPGRGHRAFDHRMHRYQDQSRREETAGPGPMRSGRGRVAGIVAGTGEVVSRGADLTGACGSPCSRVRRWPGGERSIARSVQSLMRSSVRPLPRIGADTPQDHP